MQNRDADAVHGALSHCDPETLDGQVLFLCGIEQGRHSRLAVCSASCLVFFWNTSCWILQGVEEVATQNTVLSAKAVLKGLVKSIDVAICQEVEVVAAKYDLKDGKVSIVKRGWFSGRSFYYE